MPGFTAETSLYQTSNRYQLAVGGIFRSNGNTVVIPQGCGWIKSITCGGAIAGCVVLCTSACLGGPVACGACWVGCLGISLYGFCRDCIPDIGGGGDGGGSGGGGGGGGSGCCPPGRRCCGSCASGRCDDACISPGQSCP